MFKFFIPTKVLVGENVIRKNADALLLGKRALIVTGKTSGEKSGALGDVLSVLEANHIPVTVFNQIENNPTLETTAEGGRIAREFGADFIIGIGGGSPLDAAKAIAVFATNEPIPGSGFEMPDIMKGSFPNEPLPMVAVPTTAGTGSETTPYSILTLHSIKNKQSFSSEKVFYKVAFLDGRYMKNLPLQVLRNTVVDAISHLLEGYTNTKSSLSTDYIALEGLRIIGEKLPSLSTGNYSVDDCTALLWAATLGGIVISHTATTIVHSMGYPITYYKDIPHGMANGLLLGEYLARTSCVLPEKVSLALANLGFQDCDAFSAFLHAILPCDVSFSAEELAAWSETAIKAKNVATCPFRVTRETEEAIYRSCLL